MKLFHKPAIIVHTHNYCIYKNQQTTYFWLAQESATFP